MHHPAIVSPNQLSPVHATIRTYVHTTLHELHDCDEVGMYLCSSIHEDHLLVTDTQQSLPRLGLPEETASRAALRRLQQRKMAQSQTVHILHTLAQVRVIPRFVQSHPFPCPTHLQSDSKKLAPVAWDGLALLNVEVLGIAL